MAHISRTETTISFLFSIKLCTILDKESAFNTQRQVDLTYGTRIF